MRKILKSPVGTAMFAVWNFCVKWKYRKYGLAILALALLGYALGISFQSIEAVLIIGLLFVVASFSTMYKRYFRAPPVFELMTFGVVIVTARYGFTAGLLFGMLTQLASEIISGCIDAQIVIFVPARALLALWIWVAMHIFGVISIFWLGMIAIAAYNLMVQPISFFVGDMQLKAKTIYYTIGYSLCNFFIFSILSTPAAILLRLTA